MKKYGEENKLILKSHSFRVTYATALFRAGVNPDIIKTLLNHTSIDNTYAYNRNKISKNVLNQALLKVDE